MIQITEKNLFSINIFNFNQLAFSDGKLFYGKMSEELSVPGLEVSTIPIPKICISHTEFSWFAICPLPSSFSPLPALLPHICTVFFIAML